MSFAGGGTDIADYYRTGYGAVVSSAIRKYVYVTVNKRFDDDIRISYAKTEIVDSVDKIEHGLSFYSSSSGTLADFIMASTTDLVLSEYRIDLVHDSGGIIAGATPPG